MRRHACHQDACSRDNNAQSHRAPFTLTTIVEEILSGAVSGTLITVSPPSLAASSFAPPLNNVALSIGFFTAGIVTFPSAGHLKTCRYSVVPSGPAFFVIRPTSAASFSGAVHAAASLASKGLADVP